MSHYGPYILLKPIPACGCLLIHFLVEKTHTAIQHEGMAMALLSAPPLQSRKTSIFQRPYSTSFGSIAIIKYPHKPTIPLSTTTSTASTAEDEPTASPVGVGNSSFRGCKACGSEDIERGCNGEGRIQGGIATVPGFGWWPIKAYRPCPAFVASGGRYTRQGQSMDDVASGRGKRVSPLEDK